MRNQNVPGDEMTGLRVRNARLSAGLRLIDVAASVGVSASLLSRIETGRRRPTRAMLEKLLPVLDVRLEELVGPRLSVVPSVATGTHWPAPLPTDDAAEEHAGMMRMADAALSTAMYQTLASLASASASERYRACKTLAALASRPLETLLLISHDDSDPVVREASCQLLATLSQSYCELSA